jgi:hypothetical protein
VAGSGRECDRSATARYALRPCEKVDRHSRWRINIYEHPEAVCGMAGVMRRFGGCGATKRSRAVVNLLLLERL